MEKTFTGLDPKEEWQASFDGYLGCYVRDMLYALIPYFAISKS